MYITSILRSTSMSGLPLKAVAHVRQHTVAVPPAQLQLPLEDVAELEAEANAIDASTSICVYTYYICVCNSKSNKDVSSLYHIVN